MIARISQKNVFEKLHFRQGTLLAAPCVFVY